MGRWWSKKIIRGNGPKLVFNSDARGAGWGRRGGLDFFAEKSHPGSTTHEIHMHLHLPFRVHVLSTVSAPPSIEPRRPGGKRESLTSARVARSCRKARRNAVPFILGPLSCVVVFGFHGWDLEPAGQEALETQGSGA